MGGDKSFLGDS